MKNLKIALIIAIACFYNSISAQSISDWKNVLDLYCEENFEDCFNWDYIEIVSIDDIQNLSNNKTKISGKVKNTGYGGAVYTRKFKAVVINYNNKILVNFKKHGHTILRGDYWTECENTFYK